MTGKDFLCLSPFLIIAIAPIIIMGIISIKRNYEVVYGVSLFLMILSLFSIIFVIPAVPHAIKPLFIIDTFSLFFLAIIILSAVLVILLSHDYLKGLESSKEEYYIIIQTATLGASLLAVANHFVLLFLGLELLSVSLYILIGYQREKDTSIEASVKYLVLASVSSAFLLFGMALLYTAFGTMQFNGIISGNSDEVLYPMVIAGFGMMVVGVGFKLALVPFHMWTPDVYQGASAPVTAFVATASKGAVMAVLIRFFFDFRGFDDPYLFMVISAIAILSMSIGNLLAIRQQNLKRLLAYSSIANMGYLAIILLVGSGKGIQAAIFYMLSYFITTIGAFGVISALSNSQKEADQIEDYKGLFWKNPWLALVFTLIMLSLAGIPITAGFMAKFYIVLEGMNAGLMVLVIAMIINSIIGLYYYLRVITAFFSAANDEKLPALSLTSNVTLAFITITILLLGISPGWLLSIISRFAIL